MRTESSAAAAAAAFLAVLPSCTVADNLSYDEIVTELDAIVRVEGTGADLRVAYASRAPITEWYMRWFLFAPVRAPLGFVFGVRHMGAIENPPGHVRELLLELPDEADGELLACAQAATRMGWIAELERNGHSRIVAIDGLASLVSQLGIGLFDGPLEHVGRSADPAQLTAARAGVDVGRPAVRGEQVVDEAQLKPYLDALAALVAEPLADWQQRLELVEELVEIVRTERDARARPAAEAALRTALAHCVRGVLVRTIQERDPLQVEVRLCALEQIRRLGGPRTVPLMLAVMMASPEDVARSTPRFDPDALVRLRLIHYCGQLRGELATTAVQLAGREQWEATAPADFLARTVIDEDAYYSKLRTPALAALTWCLQRPKFDPDTRWVEDWMRRRTMGS